MNDTERPMVEEHEAMLKTALKLGPSDILPAKVVDLYWEFTGTARRIGHPIGGRELVTICILSGMPTPENPISFIDAVNAGKVKLEDIVLAKFRRQWRWGRYQGYNSAQKRILVQLDDDTAEVREFNPTGVRFPIKEEMDSIGAYIN